MHRILTIFDTIWTTLQIPTVLSCSDLGQKSHFMCYASDWSWCWSVLARRSHLRWDLLETTARGYDESGTHELVTSAASPQKNSVPWCVCVCVFLSISPVHLCFDVFLSCFPINYLLSFRPLGPAMALSHITYHTRLGGGAQQFQTEWQFTAPIVVPLGVYIFDPRSMFSSSLGSLTHPHTLSPSHKPDHTITEPLQIIIINTPTQKRCVSFNPSPWRSHTPCLNSHSFPNGWAKDISNQVNSYRWNIKEEW